MPLDYAGVSVVLGELNPKERQINSALSAARWLTGREAEAAQILRFGAGGSAKSSAPDMDEAVSAGIRCLRRALGASSRMWLP